LAQSVINGPAAGLHGVCVKVLSHIGQTLIAAENFLDHSLQRFAAALPQSRARFSKNQSVYLQ